MKKIARRSSWGPTAYFFGVVLIAVSFVLMVVHEQFFWSIAVGLFGFASFYFGECQRPMYYCVECDAYTGRAHAGVCSDCKELRTQKRDWRVPRKE